MSIKSRIFLAEAAIEIHGHIRGRESAWRRERRTLLAGRQKFRGEELRSRIENEVQVARRHPPTLPPVAPSARSDSSAEDCISPQAGRLRRTRGICRSWPMARDDHCRWPVSWRASRFSPAISRFSSRSTTHLPAEGWEKGRLKRGHANVTHEENRVGRQVACPSCDVELTIETNVSLARCG